MPSCLENILPINSVDEGLDINFGNLLNHDNPLWSSLKYFFTTTVKADCFNCLDYQHRKRGPEEWGETDIIFQKNKGSI